MIDELVTLLKMRPVAGSVGVCVGGSAAGAEVVCVLVTAVADGPAELTDVTETVYVVAPMSTCKVSFTPA